MTQSQNIVGIIDAVNADADRFPLLEMMPDGFVSFMGGSLSGSMEVWATVDMKVMLSGDSIEAVMTIDQAVHMLTELERAIQSARESAESFEAAMSNLDDAQHS